MQALADLSGHISERHACKHGMHAILISESIGVECVAQSKPDARVVYPCRDHGFPDFTLIDKT
eukprot:scaffold166206_cov48-Prasinocladus_malaysianus.AAC.1